MKKLRWPLLIVLLALVAIGVLLLSQPTVLLPIVPDEIKPATGGVYTEGLVGSLSRLNPALDFNNPSDRDVDRLIFSGLIRFDDHGLPQADLAESWGISKDGKVYNFSLRTDAVWHDGKPVTSDDVIFTIDQIRDENSLAPKDVQDLWNEVEVKRLDEKTIQFRLPEAFAPFLDYLTFGILPQHLLEGVSPQDMVNNPFNLKPVGSGPYRFDHFLVENGQINGVVLAAFKNYYGKSPFIEQFVFRYYPDSNTALDAYQQGEIMGISQITVDALPRALREPNLSLHTGRLPQMTMIFFNLGNPDVPFFGDPAVRKALLLGLNRQWMVDHLLNSQAIVADGPIFPGTWAYYDGIQRIKYDAEAATAQLKELGYTIPASGGEVRTNKDGKALEFELLYPDDETHAALAEAIQRDWSRLGVGVNLKAVTYDELKNDYLDPRLYQAALVDLNLSRSPDPDPYPFWHQTQTTSGQNYSKWDDFQAREYLEQARVTADLGERIKYYRNFQVRFVEEMPALPLYYPVYNYAVNSEVQGVSMGPLFDTSDRFATVTSWYLLSKRASGSSPTPEPAGTTPAP